MKPAHILLMLLLAGLLAACDPFVSPPGGYATGDDPGLAFLQLRLDSTIQPAWPNEMVWFGDTILQYGLPVDGYPWCFRDFTDLTNSNAPVPLPQFWPGPASRKPIFSYNNVEYREAIMRMEDGQGREQYLHVDFTHLDQPRRKACFRLSLANFSPWILGCFNGYLLARKWYAPYSPAADTIFIYNLNLLSPQDTSFQDISGKHTGILIQEQPSWSVPLLRGQYLYTSGYHSDSPLCVYDLSDPEHPVLVWKVEDVAAPYLLEAGNTLLGYGTYDGIRAFDASDLARPLPGMGIDNGDLYAVGLKDSILYTLSGSAPYLDVYSIRNPAQWKHLRRIRVGDGSGIAPTSTIEMRFYGDTLVCGGLCFTGNTY